MKIKSIPPSSKSPKPISPKINPTLDPKHYHQIVKWYLEGRSLSEVADIASIEYDTHLSVHTVHSIVEKSRRHYGKKDLNDRHTLILDELAKIDRLENEYWLAWHRSLDFSTKTDSERLVSSDPTQTLQSQNDANSTLGEDDDDIELDGEKDASTSEHNIHDATRTGEDDPSSVWDGWARIERADHTQQYPNASGQYDSRSNASGQYDSRSNASGQYDSRSNANIYGNKNQGYSGFDRFGRPHTTNPRKSRYGKSSQSKRGRRYEFLDAAHYTDDIAQQ
jgi:hypothetical protein